MIKRIIRLWRRAGREDGNSTIEFVIWFPFYILVFGSGFEASFITFRQVMLSMALDRTVRDLQLGHLDSPTHSELKTELCNTAGFIPDCMNTLHIELERIQTDTFTFRTGNVQCIDVEEESEPAINFTHGSENDLMLITACIAVEPMVPVTGLGLKLPKINDGSRYAIIGYSAYVVEPA